MPRLASRRLPRSPCSLASRSACGWLRGRARCPPRATPQAGARPDDDWRVRVTREKRPGWGWWPPKSIVLWRSFRAWGSSLHLPQRRQPCKRTARQVEYCEKARRNAKDPAQALICVLRRRLKSSAFNHTEISAHVRLAEALAEALS